MQEIQLKISGMSCGHCVSSVTQALEAVNGVVQAEVNLQDGSAVVTGDQFDIESLVQAVVEEGYRATEKEE